MLCKTQNKLRYNGLSWVVNEYKLNYYSHPKLPLFGLKYTLDSPRLDPVVRECRGIILEKNTFKVVGRPFNRFFNVGDVQEEFKQFNWGDFTCVNKVDGSLIILYNYRGVWHVNTSGSFGLGTTPYGDKTWRELFWETADFWIDRLEPTRTYCFELCTPYNKVVKDYEPTVFLIGVFERIKGGEVYRDFSERAVDLEAERILAHRPKIYEVRDKEGAKTLMRSLETLEEVEEGIIIRDNRGARFKWKTEKYLSLHRLKSNDNIMLGKNLVKAVLAGSAAEISLRFPEIQRALSEVEREINRVVEEISNIWFVHGDIGSQKKFALKVKEHPFAWVLFGLRKKCELGPGCFKNIIRQFLLDRPDKVADTLFGKRIFEYDFK